MTPETWRRVEEEYSNLRDADPVRRGERLEELRAENPDLAAEVERLLDAQVDADFLQPVASAASDPRPGRNMALPAIRDFEVIRQLGAGGMGIVYLARDILLRRLVALKLLSAPHGASGSPPRRFQREARTIARLRHPGIVQIYRYGEDGASLYIAMEYVDGATLSDRLKEDTASGSGADPVRVRARLRAGGRGALLQRDRIAAYARVVAEVADALDHAHQRGVIHCDVKPSNILIDQAGHAHLADFGIARTAVDATVTKSDRVGATFAYMSPEQAGLKSFSIDYRSDIFSLGVVLYEIVTLERPFGDTLDEIIRRINSGEPPRHVRHVNPAADRDLAIICHKAIAVHREDRYRSAAHMAGDLRCWLNHQPILSHPLSLRRRLSRWIARHRIRVAGSSIVVLLIMVMLLFLVLKHGRDERKAWLRIQPVSGNCIVRFQRVDERTLQLLPPAQDESLDHDRTFDVDPGHYRVTVVLAGSATEPAFAELDLLLLKPGRSAVTSVIVTKSTVPSSSDIDGAFVARLASAAEVGDALRPAMVTVSGDDYDLGLGEAGPILQRRIVTLDAFLLDKMEVSNAEYLAFLRATAGGPAVLRRLDCIEAKTDLDRASETRDRNHHPHTPEFWKTQGYDAALADRPVVGLRIQDAEAYACWAGKRLPTMFELEAAARGPAKSGPKREEYPVAVDLTRTDYTDCKVLRADQSTNVADHIAQYKSCSHPVDSEDPFPSPCGAMHLYDNVREISSTIDLRNLDGVAKGRCWLDEPAYAPLGAAWTYPLSAWYYDRGFRCAKSVVPVQIP